MRTVEYGHRDIRIRIRIISMRRLTLSETNENKFALLRLRGIPRHFELQPSAQTGRTAAIKFESRNQFTKIEFISDGPKCKNDKIPFCKTRFKSGYIICRTIYARAVRANSRRSTIALANLK